MPDANVILLPVKELIWLSQISYLSEYFPSEREIRMNRYPYAQILLEEVIKRENITVVYTPMGCLDKNNGTIPVKEDFLFTLDIEDNWVIKKPDCPIFLKRELLPIINNRIKPYMQRLYSLEIETQADLEKDIRYGEENPAGDEEVTTRRKKSYLKIIAVLCNRNGKIDPAGRDSTGILKTELENFGFALSDDTIRSILKETQTLIEQESRIRI